MKLFLLFFTLCTLSALPAHAQLALSASVTGSGAVEVQGGNFRLHGTIGQVAVGRASSNTMSATMGFWFGAAEAASTPIEAPTTEIPDHIHLDQNYPNPFNPSTTIRYGVPATGPVRLAVYDLLGREVAVLVEATQSPGTYRVTLDAAGWSSGVYLYRITTNEEVRTRYLTLLK